MWSRSGTDQARCHLCNLETRRNKIKRHLKEVHSIGLTVFKCTRCSKTFKRKYKYERHVTSYGCCLSTNQGLA